jgi:hypothetical protein
MRLTLLANIDLPNCYCIDAFLTSMYLIDQTKVLTNLPLYSVLYKTIPIYSELRTFSCIYYPYFIPYKDHKLAFRLQKNFYKRSYYHSIYIYEKQLVCMFPSLQFEGGVRVLADITTIKKSHRSIGF